MSARLLVYGARRCCWQHLLDPDLDYGTCIGRGRMGQVVLPSPSVGRRHLVVRCNEVGRWVAHDMSSTNGTLVDGLSTDLAILQEGSQIDVGDNHLVFTMAPPTAWLVDTETWVGQIPLAGGLTFGSDAFAHWLEALDGLEQDGDGHRLGDLRITEGDEVRLHGVLWRYVRGAVPVQERHGWHPHVRKVAEILEVGDHPAVVQGLELAATLDPHHVLRSLGEARCKDIVLAGSRRRSWAECSLARFGLVARPDVLAGVRELTVHVRRATPWSQLRGHAGPGPVMPVHTGPLRAMPNLRRVALSTLTDFLGPPVPQVTDVGFANSNRQLVDEERERLRAVFPAL